MLKLLVAKVSKACVCFKGGAWHPGGCPGLRVCYRVPSQPCRLCYLLAWTDEPHPEASWGGATCESSLPAGAGGGWGASGSPSPVSLTACRGRGSGASAWNAPTPITAPAPAPACRASSPGPRGALHSRRLRPAGLVQTSGWASAAALLPLQPHTPLSGQMGTSSHSEDGGVGGSPVSHWAPSPPLPASGCPFPLLTSQGPPGIKFFFIF